MEESEVGLGKINVLLTHSGNFFGDDILTMMALGELKRSKKLDLVLFDAEITLPASRRFCYAEEIPLLDYHGKTLTPLTNRILEGDLSNKKSITYIPHIKREQEIEEMAKQLRPYGIHTETRTLY